ncbi:probable serine/threonine-protein kinase roco9 [Vigna radiata var. radiata]|uniref:Probable serine/threonine-protein kinase roco9 n=1 Tax=Vigna radiata var. radiata TaxID=3916 RepID=A0A1S3U0X7_VIGRR|nr:probable serine/threonine-protein kinase roco9 [Vigna radiata var. radiata]
MYSFTVKPFFVPYFISSSSSSSSTSTSSSSISLASFSSRSLSSISFPRNSKYRGRFGLKVEAYDSSNNDASNPASAGDSKPPNGTLSKSRREILLEYVKNVQPEFMELFVKRAPQQVVDAMRQTVTNMIGTLPPQFFAVTITTVAENLAQLMYSVIMTGYMFRNAQYRLELQEGLEQVAALPDVQDKKDVPDYAPGTQKNVSGEVIRWNNVSGPEKIDAKKYIELLEAEIEELNRQVGRQSSNAQNELLEYLKSLEPRNLKELTSSAGEDVVFAMNTFIKRLLAVSDPSQMKTSVTETSAAELAKLLYWLMVVGYSIRNIEVRFDMERVLGTSPKLAELPPGENV